MVNIAKKEGSVTKGKVINREYARLVYVCANIWPFFYKAKKVINIL